MIYTIGAGVGPEFWYRGLVITNKIIIMTDADTDGAHIQVLLSDIFLPIYETIFFVWGPKKKI